ncbi:MAG: zf-HC2 domain-containing protein [Capsulimonadaceae bacterium]|nr:zf-HC2 domain-containing protein [Capsulimonadaceae bacterium]
MLSCQQVRDEFTDYFDELIGPEERAYITNHLSQCAECAAEYGAFARTLEVIRAVPAEEPALDLWPEFARQMDEITSQERASVLLRVRRRWDEALARVSEGAILYTAGLADRTAQRLAKYLIHDPFRAKE